MTVKIKKITRRTLISMISLGGLLLALITRLFLGGFHINLSKLNSQTKNVISNANLIDIVHADVPGSGDSSSSPADGDGHDSGSGSGGE